MTPAVHGTGLPRVEPGGQRAEPSSSCELLGPLDHGRCPAFWDLSLSKATVFLGVYFLSQFGKMSPAFIVPSTFMSVH